jgi:D-sedoheptulose 7-phosphate isomerase
MADNVQAGQEIAAIKGWIAGAARVIAALDGQAETMHAICTAIEMALRDGKKILTCGNGGSAAEALHLAEELIGKYSRVRRALPAVCLNSDVTALTCIANDWGYDYVFGRQVEGLAQKGDVLVIFSTSGNSENLLRACTAMRQTGGVVIGLLGKGGGKSAPLCDLSLIVQDSTAHIQEAHQVLLHIILEQIETRSW